MVICFTCIHSLGTVETLSVLLKILFGGIVAGTPPKLICEMDGEPCFSWRVFGSCSQSWTCIPSMLFKAGLHSWFESNYCVTECICLYIREIHMQMHICQQINYIEQHRTSIQIIPIRYIYIYIQYIVIYCVYDYIYTTYIYICVCVSLTFSITIVTRAVCFLLSTVGFPQHCLEVPA